MRKRVLWILYAAGLLLVVCVRTAAASETDTICLALIEESRVAEHQRAEETAWESYRLADAFVEIAMTERNALIPELAAQNPRTGEHPAPILAAMGLVLSGVMLVMAFDGKHRKK